MSASKYIGKTAIFVAMQRDDDELCKIVNGGTNLAANLTVQLGCNLTTNQVASVESMASLQAVRLRECRMP
jgi:hypothetical protein